MIVAIDGPDGSGKSSVIKELADFFPADEVVCTRCPGAPQSKTCVELRKVFLSEETSESAQYNIIWADFYQMFEEVVKPNFDKIVLIDRFVTSTYVYQVILNPESPGFYKIIADTLEFYNKYKELWPRYLFYLATPAKVILERLSKRPTKKTKFDRMVLYNPQPVLDAYEQSIKWLEKLFCFDSFSIKVIDANRPLECVTQDIYNIIESELKL